MLIIKAKDHIVDSLVDGNRKNNCSLWDVLVEKKMKHHETFLNAAIFFFNYVQFR